ncbi:MAG: serine hydrolase [Woeseiaceae bacterium]|nr:serine hydrolase [Woeseiaceae bacterium]
MKTKFLVILLLASLSLTAFADEEEEAPPATLEELRERIAAIVEENELPSVGIALVDADGPLWIDAIGKANIEEDIDADAETMYRIGSTSKMFVSLAVLKLVEEGRLSLDDKLADLAPEIEFENPWEDTDPIRVVHLLEHTTGWDDIHLAEYAHNVYPPTTLKEGLDYHPHSRTSRWVPGTRSSYCNAGPPVAAYLVEKVTGQEFESYIQETFFAPMGMETMTYQWSDVVQEKGVVSYMNGNTPQDYWHIIMRPSGSINASPNDMARLASFFINRGSVDGVPLVSPDSITRMEFPASTSAARAGQTAGYGLSNFMSSHESWLYHGHDGGVNGGLTEFAYLPDAGIGHAIMLNSGDYIAFTEIRDLVRAFETRNLEAPDSPPAVEVTDAHRTIEGFYQPINPRQQVGYFLERVVGVQTLRFDGDKLIRKPVLGDEDDAAVYLPVSSTLFKSEESGAIVMSRVEDPLAGNVVHLGTAVFQPISAVIVYAQLGIAILWALSIVTAVLYFLIWGVRRMRGRIPPGPPIRIRLWPLLASLSIITVVVGFSVGMSDPFSKLGSPTPASITITVATLAFFVFAVLAAYTSWQLRNAQMNRVNYWYSTITSWVHLVVALYLLNFGVIGLMTWS